MSDKYCLATAIGSLPHKDVNRACRIILENLPDAPIWPQLAKRSFKENMYVQYSENLPCVVLDEQAERVFFETTKDVEQELERFYQRYIDQDIDYFKISRDHAAGFYLILEELKERKTRFVKGHLTGPISFGLTVTDEHKKSIIYNEQIFDCVVKGLAMKALWQISKFKILNRPSIIFLDEPYLAAFGSSYISLGKDDVIKPLNETIDIIKDYEDVLVGIHCCANTDWSMLMETKADIISFDAYGFIDNLALYPDDLTAFLKRGGILAWGIVPSGEEVMKEDCGSLVKRFEAGLELLSGRGVQRELLLKNLFITPSCGTGSLLEEVAERAFSLTLELTNQIRKEKQGRNDSFGNNSVSLNITGMKKYLVFA